MIILTIYVKYYMFKILTIVKNEFIKNYIKLNFFNREFLQV